MATGPMTPPAVAKSGLMAVRRALMLPPGRMLTVISTAAIPKKRGHEDVIDEEFQIDAGESSVNEVVVGGGGDVWPEQGNEDAGNEGDGELSASR